MQEARLPQDRRGMKVCSATHNLHHDRSHYRHTGKKKQIAVTSRKGLELRRRSGVDFGRDSNASSCRCIGLVELDWMEFGKGRMTLDSDCFLRRGGDCGVLIGVLEVAPFVLPFVCLCIRLG